MYRLIALLILTAGLAAALVLGLPMLAAHWYGPPSPTLSPVHVLQYSARLLWDDGLITAPPQTGGAAIEFEVGQGESVISICNRLEAAGLIRDAAALRDYLIYTGLDTTMQAGKYHLQPSMSAIEVAREMQDATPEEVTFVVLPGWRQEEIAASLPTSGLEISQEDFRAATAQPPGGFDYLVGASTAEGFLYPDAYVLPRATQPRVLIESMVRNFDQHLGSDLRAGYSRQGLTVYQAVILASIVQREAVHSEEGPLIASVFLKRLAAGMRLDADPTVQYALGYNEAQGGWWTNPLSLEDLKISSPFNTYVIDGLPPTPIDNPGAEALRSVAEPAVSPYYYFSARCDGSGFHNFAQTFDEHLANICH